MKEYKWCTYLVDLVENVYAGYISAVALDNVDQLVHTNI